MPWADRERHPFPIRSCQSALGSNIWHSAADRASSSLATTVASAIACWLLVGWGAGHSAR